jgi:hypothetical protein
MALCWFLRVVVVSACWVWVDLGLGLVVFLGDFFGRVIWVGVVLVNQR